MAKRNEIWKDIEYLLTNSDMEGKKLLKGFCRLPEHEQNKILTEVFIRMADTHRKGIAYARFSWSDCKLANGKLSIDVDASEPLDENNRTENYTDYASLIYCLSTGRRSAESMNWDAGRKIKSAVLREIVLTLCGRNYSMYPLIERLQQPYVDEDTFFDGITTVDEKEGLEAYKKRQRIETEKRKHETQYNASQSNNSMSANISDVADKTASWPKRIMYFIILALCFGGYKTYRYNKKMEQRQQIEYFQKQNEQLREIRELSRNMKLVLPHRSKRSDPDSSKVETK